MTEEQKKGYNDLVASISKEIKSSENKAGKMSCAMMELRKQANHPLLRRGHYDNQKLRKMAKLMMEVGFDLPLSLSLSYSCVMSLCLAVSHLSLFLSLFLVLPLYLSFYLFSLSLSV